MHRKKNLEHIYLLTGAAGFVGSCLLRQLVAEKLHTAILLKKDSDTWRIKDLLRNAYVSVYYVDLNDLSSLKKIIKKIQPDVIYHLAARGAYSSQSDPSDIFQTNIFGTLNLMQASADIPYRLFINTGSSSEYGFKNVPMTEEDLLEPMSYYAVAKSATTHLAAFMGKTQHKPIVTVRLFSVYGPYEEPTRLLPTVMKAFSKHTPLQLVSGKIARDFIYIEDVIDFYLSIEQLEKFPGECFNLGTGQQRTIEDVVAIAQKISRLKTDLHWQTLEPKSWDTAHWVADMSKTKNLLHWEAKYSLEEGMKKMWEWWQSYQKLYD